MTSKQLNEELQGLLYKALKKYLVIKLNELPNEKIYAFAVYCDSGCRSMGGAVSTIESLSEKINDQPGNEEITAFELHASEWKYVNEHYHIFEEVDKCIDSAYEEFYEGEFEDVDLEEFDDVQLWEFISNFFIEAIIATLNKLKEEEIFKNESFVEDVFLGMQFGDPGDEDQKMLLTVSEKLNSPYWHSSLLKSLNKNRLIS